MSTFVVTLKDRTTQTVEAADAYAQEGQMTTFFRTEEGRGVVDSWSTRLFSVRTTEILMIRRHDEDLLGGVHQRGERSLRPAAPVARAQHGRGAVASALAPIS